MRGIPTTCLRQVRGSLASSFLRTAFHTAPVNSKKARAPEHRVQYNYDLFSLHPEDEHYSYPLVTADDLARSKARPRSVRMLARDFIHDSLYNTHYGYFSRQAVLLPSANPLSRVGSDTASPAVTAATSSSTLDSAFPFHDIKNETDFMRAVQLRYMAFEKWFQNEMKARERRRHDSEPTLQERIDALIAKQKQTPWGSTQRLELAREIGRLQRDQSQEQVSDTEVDTMVAGQVWHTPTQLFSVRMTKTYHSRIMDMP